MNKPLQTLACIAIMLFVSSGAIAQGAMKVAAGTNLKVLTASSLKISEDFDISTGADLDIFGDVTVTGTVTCTDATAITIHSTSASDDGSFIFASGTPQATVQRFITNSKWHQVSIPISSGATATDFHFNHTPSAWFTRWDVTNSEWVYITDLAETLYMGEGFDIYIETEDKVVDFTGPLSSSDFTYNSGSIPPLVNAGDGYNLVGNPFTSAIDVDDDAINDWTFTNLEKTIWVLDQSVSAANYVSRAVAAGTGSLTDGVIPMEQAFFVHVTGGSQVLTIPNARRTHNDKSFYKSTSNSNYNVDSYFIMNTSKGDTKDVIWITFGDNGTNEFDNGFDASKYFGDEAAPQLYMKEDLITNELSINHLPNINENERIVDVSFVAGTDGEQVFTANTTGLLEIDVELEDLLTYEFHNLIENPTYTFTGSKQDDPNRFRLHFYSTTGIDDPEEGNTEAESINIYAWNKAVYIRNNEINSHTLLVSIYDLMGRQILTKEIENNSLTKIPVSVNQAYLVVKVLSQGKVKTSKVYIK